MNSPSAGGFHFLELPLSRPSQSLCEVVAEGLGATPKRIPCRFFYDEVGSALFEEICGLPEYYLTRTEQSILNRVAPEIVESVGREIAVVEFGSGSSNKTRTLIEASLARQSHLHYVPIDISQQFLRSTCLDLQRRYDRLSVTGIAAEYSDSLEVIPSHTGPRLFLFLGSNIGNFEADEAAEFLRSVGDALQPEDRLLVGFDRVKEESLLFAAYNDAAGVTARFNKNLLHRINVELGADFDLDGFEHSAPYVRAKSRIEMHLVSGREQIVNIRAIGSSVTIARGEIVHTENSHKYTLDAFAAIAGEAGLIVQNVWTDERDWFGLALLSVGPNR